MAVVIPMHDIVRARRRDAERACVEQCVDILSANLRANLDAFDAAGPELRPVFARRVRHLSALLEYAVRLP